jgi:hypothetical protein
MDNLKNIFSAKYIEYLEKLKKAENIYKIEPNDYTKKILDEIRAVNFTLTERFTPEYLKEYYESKKRSEIKAEDEIKHLLNSMHIEDQFEAKKISMDRRFELHELNDLKYNKTFLSYGNNY